MRIDDLPAYFERGSLTGWRDTYARRKHKIPLVSYHMLKVDEKIDIMAPDSTDVSELLETVLKRGYDHLTMMELAMRISDEGDEGALRDTYMKQDKELMLVVDPVQDDGRITVGMGLGDDWVFVTAPPRWTLRSVLMTLSYVKAMSKVKEARRNGRKKR